MTALDVDDLFTPATAATWNTTILQNADTLKLRTTAWQPGGVTRTICAVFANLLALEDVAISLLSQAGFLDYAATGTVTYTDPVSGQEATAYVTPDPSDPVQNPTGALGALDVLADEVYNVQRILQTYAGGTMAILNTSVTTYGPYAADGYHVAQPAALGSPTYHNTAELSIPPSTTVGSVTDATNASPINIELAAHGLTTGDIVWVASVGGNTAANGAWEVTVVDADNFTLDGSTGNGSYTSGGTVYLPTTAAFTADIAGSASDADDPNTITQAVTSLVGVSVANVEPFLGSDTESNTALAARCRLKLQSISSGGPRGAYEFFALSAQTYAPLLTPPQEVASAITRALVQVDQDTRTVTTTIANAAGAPGGDMDTPGTDVYAVHSVIVAYAVANGDTAYTQAAAENTMPVTVTAWVPSAYASAATAIIQVATQVFFRVLPIGGVTDTDASPAATNVVPYDALVGAVFAAAQTARITIQDLDLALDGGTSNVQLALTPVPEVAVLSPSTPTVTIVAV